MESNSPNTPFLVHAVKRVLNGHSYQCKWQKSESNLLAKHSANWQFFGCKLFVRFRGNNECCLCKYRGKKNPSLCRKLLNSYATDFNCTTTSVSKAGARSMDGWDFFMKRECWGGHTTRGTNQTRLWRSWSFCWFFFLCHGYDCVLCVLMKI